MTSSKAERDAARRLREVGDAIVTGVEQSLPRWVEDQVRRVLDAWGRASPATRGEAETAAGRAGVDAARRVSAALSALLAADVDAQWATPLEIVRTAYREPTEILRVAGVPPIARDAFDVRAWPDDDYGLVPRTLGDLGDDGLAPLHLAWGVAKASVLRERRGTAPPAKG